MKVLWRFKCSQSNINGGKKLMLSLEFAQHKGILEQARNHFQKDRIKQNGFHNGTTTIITYWAWGFLWSLHTHVNKATYRVWRKKAQQHARAGGRRGHRAINARDVGRCWGCADERKWLRIQITSGSLFFELSTAPNSIQRLFRWLWIQYSR